MSNLLDESLSSKADENTPVADQSFYEEAAFYLFSVKKSDDEVLYLLTQKGLSDGAAATIITGLHAQYNSELRNKAKKDMLWGGVWFFGGIIATVADFGLIFWGAILFGGIQFFRGVSNYAQKNK